MKRGLAYAALMVVSIVRVRAADGTLLRETAAAMQAGDFAAAELKLRQQLNSTPEDAELLSLLGVVLDARQRSSEADTLYRKALALSPQSVPVIGRYANHLLAKGDDQGAQHMFEKVLANDPGDANANLQLARLALKNKDAAHAKQALQYLDRLPAQLQSAPEAAVPRLVALDRAGDKRAADSLVEEISRATENDPRLSSSIGWTLARADQYAQAEVFLRHSLASNPSDFQLLYDLGVVALYARDYQKASEVLEKAVRQEPHNADALFSLAFVYNSLKKPESALRLLAEAAKVAPRRADVQRLIAVVAGELQANEDAAAAWDRYAALEPKDDSARRERGFARIHMRQFDVGLADLEWYIGRHSDDPVGYYELGLAQSMNDPTKGLSSLDRALELRPDFVEARAARGALQYLQGNPEAAVPDLEAAAARRPEDGLILDRLGQTYRALDRLDDSIRTLRNAMRIAPNESTIVLHLANALAEADKKAESEMLMGRYRQMRPTQGPRDLMRYLSLSPEQQRSDYRARVEKAVRDNPGDANAELHYLRLSLDDGQIEQAQAAASAIADMKAAAALLADAGRAMLAARQYPIARQLLEKAVVSDAAPEVKLALAIAVFHSAGPGAGLEQMNSIPEASRNADYHLALGQMLDSTGRGEEALTQIGRALASEPGRPDLYWEQTALLKKAGRAREADQSLLNAEKLLPREPVIPVLRAALMGVDGAESALGLLAAAKARWPEAAPIWVAQGAILGERGDTTEARQALETAVSLGAHGPETLAFLEQLKKSQMKSRKAITLDEVFFTRPPQEW